MKYFKYKSRVLLLSILLLFLVACSIEETPTASTETQTTHVVTIELNEGDTEASVQTQYGGEIIAWGDDFAVLHFEEAGELSSEAFSFGEVEKNEASFSIAAEVGFNGSRAWADGSRAWAGGSRAWAGGSRAWADGSRAWADGTFEMLPENTEAWLQIGLDEAYQLAPKLGYGVKVAVIDTGLDLNHPALVDALAPESEWLDLVDGDQYPQEEGVLGEGGYGHGTIVAGIVRQIAPAATILPIRILDENGAGYLSDLVEAITWAREKGADVINMSLGSKSYSFSVDLTMSYVASKAVTMVSSAGNSGDENVVFPAYRAPSKWSGYNRLSVTSVDVNDVKSDFATFGSTVEIAAPGEQIFGPAPDLRMANWSGTSMAAPVASGALALAMGENLTVESYQLLEKLQETATPLEDLKGNSDFEGQLGSGRINLVDFLTTVLTQSE